MKNKFIQISLVLFLFFGGLSCKNDAPEVKAIEPVATQVVINNSKDLVSEAKKGIDQISPEQLKGQLKNEGVYLIDVREKKEFDAGNIPGSVLIPRGLLEFKIGSNGFWENSNIKMPDKDQKIIVYCKSGGRGSLATKSLKEMGYTNVVNLDGGFQNWAKDYPEEISIPQNK